MRTKTKSLDVWTPFGDCGVDFQTGETYLVYADDDEESNLVSTDTCSGTKRLSDAGSDLAYLYFFENSGAIRRDLDGFATTNQFHQLDALHAQAPVAGVVVELKSASGSRFTESGGRRQICLRRPGRGRLHGGRLRRRISEGRTAACGVRSASACGKGMRRDHAADFQAARASRAYFFFPCAATASIAAFTFSGSPR